MSKRGTWYKLDLSANVYPTLQRRTFSSVYRISVTLKRKINPDQLQTALERTLPRFPGFKVAIRKGVFWRYLEPNNRKIEVQEDISNPCMPIDFKDHNRFLIRVYYYQNTISFEAFHSLADGNGALVFLKTLTAQYLKLQGIDVPCTDGVLDVDEDPPPGEMEDAYMKYATSAVTNKRSNGTAYRVKGTREPFYTLNIIAGDMSVTDLKQAAHRYGATITEYLMAALLYAIQEQQKSSGKMKQPVKIALPVNLRSFFETQSLRNFIVMLYPGIDPRMGEYEFDEIIKQLHYYMQYHLNRKFLCADITTNAKVQRSLPIRIVPLFVKDQVVKSFYKRVQDKQSSAGLTNLGVVKVPEEMKNEIERFDVLMGQPFSARTNCAIISFNGRTTINFADSIMETDIEKYFFRKLVKDGVHVNIRSNRNRNVS